MSASETHIEGTEYHLHGLKLFIATIALGIGTLLISLDQFIANVAIPTISGELGVSENNGTWVITSYTIANAIVIPLTGWLTGIFGRVRLFGISAILFAVMSLLCGLAVNFPMLLFFRVMQGSVSGALIPLSQALLLLLYPKKKGFAMGIWGLVVMVGPAVGPVLGGWITANFDWRWIFYINVPLGILAGTITMALLRELESKRKWGSIDFIGLALLVLTVSSFQIMLDRGTDDNWFRSSFIVGLGIIAFVCFCFFIVWELFHKKPIVDLSFFKSRNFSMGCLSLGLGVALIFGNLIIGPIWVQQVLGYTPLWAGYSIAFLGASALIFFPLVGIYLRLMDPRLWAAIGFILLGLPFFYLAYLPIDAPFLNIALPRLVQGVGFALLFVPVSTLSLSGIPEEKIASAAGIFNFTRMVCISSSVALTAAFYSLRENFFQSRYSEYIIPSNPQFALYYHALEKKLGLIGPSADAFVYRMMQGQAFTETFLELCYISGWVYLMLTLLTLFFRSPRAARERAKRLASSR